MKKKKSLIGIFAILFMVVFAISCALFTACGSNGDDSTSGDIPGSEQTEDGGNTSGENEGGDSGSGSDSSSSDSDSGSGSGGSGKTEGSDSDSGSGSGSSGTDSGSSSGSEDSGSGGTSHIHQYEVSDESWGEDHTTYTATLTCTKSNCTWTNNTYTVSTSAVSEVVRQETCTEIGSVRYSSVAVPLDDGTQYSTTITERINMAPHDLESYTDYRDAKCLEDGVIGTWQCTKCLRIWEKVDGEGEAVGNEITESKIVIPAYGHNLGSYTDNNDGMCHTSTCTRCNEPVGEWHDYNSNGVCTACNNQYVNTYNITFTGEAARGWTVSSVFGSGSGIANDTVVIPATYSGGKVTAFSSGSSATQTNIHKIIVGPNITSISSNVFTGSSNLKEATFTGLTTVDSTAFQNCSALAKIDLGPAITTINANAFSGCSALTELFIPSTVTTMSANVFGTSSGTNSNLKLYIEKTKEEVESASGWTKDESGTSGWDSYLCGTVYYYSEGEPEVYSETVTKGSTTYTCGFWHYVDGEITIWEAGA